MDMGAVGTVDGFQNEYPKPFVEGDGKRPVEAQKEATDLTWENEGFTKAYHRVFKVILGAPS